MARAIQGVSPLFCTEIGNRGQTMISVRFTVPLAEKRGLSPYSAQLSHPELSGFDAILFDEAQDANPAPQLPLWTTHCGAGQSVTGDLQGRDRGRSRPAPERAPG